MHTTHELQIYKFTSKVSQQVCVLVQQAALELDLASNFYSVHCLCPRSKKLKVWGRTQMY